MDTVDTQTLILREREIGFKAPHPVDHQADRACELLRGLQGIQALDPISPLLLRVSYDLRYVGLACIEELLQKDGLHLDNSLFSKLKRALYQYMEENICNQLLEQSKTGELNDQVYVSCYRRLRHGCRDDRPEHWRQYR